MDMRPPVSSDMAIFLAAYGDISGFILKSEIIGVSVATDDENIINVYLRNGHIIKHFVDYESQSIDDELLRIYSDLGWT